MFARNCCIKSLKTPKSSIASLSRPPRLSKLLTFRRFASMEKPSTDPPAHKLFYFPKITTSLPASSPEFRRVLWTGLYSQAVLMTVPVGGDIGDEVHTVDQILTFTAGVGKAIVAGQTQEVKAGDMVIVPAGTQHQFENIGKEPLVWHRSQYYFHLQQTIF